ncbi:peptidogalycan biosysnthesis/recognition protein [Nitzschia inconspicua]|uniref:Peptidogalycan biosysnthesis/recognition protein n=1 Tax=Nitzschia inconspicua TaxID=303405 RepID=A0A9K3L791_9STRA|nr:peptidogalycan biosysnthesis/recognition protein [Nitzschia inconspicua]
MGLQSKSDENDSSSPFPNLFKFELVSSISDISEEDWDRCLCPQSSPFMEHSWLRCLEEGGCATVAKGWMPSHVRIIMGDRICGFVPLYVKSHSMGEFIFDSKWADAAHANDIRYYPKLLVGVPFTPVTGTRILIDQTFREESTPSQLRAIRKLVSSFLEKLALDNNMSSVHINFATEEEVSDIAGPMLNVQRRNGKNNTGDVRTNNSHQQEEGRFLRRTSIQYHWRNANPRRNNREYQSFNEYLSCFRSKRRISVKRERLKVREEEGIKIDAIVGREILQHEGLIDRIYEIYVATVDKWHWGRQYLTLDFFRLLAKSSFVDNLCFMCARRRSASSNQEFRSKDVVAGTFNCIKNGVFYGRYWGCLEEVKNLHFETCYWSAIEYCIENGLVRMEPGAGGGDYKWSRGFDPVLIHSAHFIRHPGLRHAIRQFISYETSANLELRDFLRENSVIHNDENTPNKQEESSVCK